MLELSITEADHGKSFFLNLGTRIRITLRENPTTGFRWNLTNYNETILKLESNDFVLQPETQIGGGGMRQLCFVTLASGKSIVELKKTRAWEKEVPEKNMFAVTVVVEAIVPKA